MTADKDNFEETRTSNPILNKVWSIRPCEVYKDEYDDCTSIKARFHQYFVHGETIDCSQWKTDYKNCQLYEESNGNNIEAGQAVIESEEHRRSERLKAHYGNTTWKRRNSPPENWAAPLPEWQAKRMENTYLELKQKELEGKVAMEKPEVSYCSIM